MNPLCFPDRFRAAADWNHKGTKTTESEAFTLCPLCLCGLQSAGKSPRSQPRFTSGFWRCSLSMNRSAAVCGAPAAARRTVLRRWACATRCDWVFNHSRAPRASHGSRPQCAPILASDLSLHRERNGARSANRSTLGRWSRLILWSMLLAQESFFPKATWGADTNWLVARWLSAQTNVQTWSADVTQIRSLKTLA